MLDSKQALREIFADTLGKNPIKDTLDEMLARGMPKAIYDKYLEEAIALGIIPVPGKSNLGGKVLTAEDILTKDDVLSPIDLFQFEDNEGWYGIGP